jgi:hypothetical protein
MKQRWFPLVMLVGVVLVGCGGTVPAPEEKFASTEQELVTCSTSCAVTGATISCQGTSCSAQNGSYVQCDGNYTYCPDTCTGSTCEALHGTSCSPNGAQRDCCFPDGTTGGCFCSKGQWICTL